MQAANSGESDEEKKLYSLWLSKMRLKDHIKKVEEEGDTAQKYLLDYRILNIELE